MLHLNLPLGVTNEGRGHQANFWRCCRGLNGSTNTRVLVTANFWRRYETPISKIGELHTIFYLCFLVLLVYFSVFTFVSLIKNTKNTYYLSCVVKYVRSWYYEGI